MACIQNVHQPDFQTYMLLLCLVYMSVMVLFHVDLQETRQVQVAKRNSFVHITNGNVKSAANEHHTNSLNFSTIKAVVTDKEEKQNRQIKPQRANIKQLFEPHSVDCLNDNGNNFVEIVRGTLYVYSAYLDERSNDFDNRDNGSYIRIMGAMRGRNVTPKTQCLFNLENGTITSEPINYYEMCENHGRPYGGFILSCRVPRNVSLPLCDVRVTGVHNEENGTVLKVTSLRPKPNRVEFGICIPPLFGGVNTKQLVEFIELSQLLGAGKVTFYNYGVSNDIVKVFRYYEARGTVSVAPWKYPAKLERLSWYHGQLIAIQDCLYRNMNTVRVLGFNDIDEYIVPHQHANWEAMMTAMFKSKQCGFQFQNAFFKPAINSEDLMTLASTQRTSHMSALRTKCMVRSELVYELGIHHVSKPILAHLKVAMMPTNVAFLHHYRPCMKDFGFNCEGQVDDNRTMKYATQLRSRVNMVLGNL